MAFHPEPSDEQLRLAVSVAKEHGTNLKAAKLAGVASSTGLVHRLKIAARRGLMGTAPVLAGFAIKQTSTQLGPDGELQREWIQQAPEAGPEYRFAHHQMIGGIHHIVFSSRFVGRHELLLATMAHELIHVHQEHSCINSRNPHGKAFQRFADRICKIHEFDRLVF